MATTAARRALKFENLGEVMPEVDRLLENGHATIGKWSLSQICRHLTDGFVGSIDGFDLKAPWILRKTIAPIIKKRLLRSRTMPEKVGLPDEAVPKPGLDARAEAEALRAAIRYFQGNTSSMAEHPFFGPMTAKEWTALHEIHCGHHLSFVLPS